MEEEELKEIYAVHEIIDRHMRQMATEAAEVTDEIGIFAMSLLRTAVDLTKTLLTVADSKDDMSKEREILIASIASELRGSSNDNRTQH